MKDLFWMYFRSIIGVPSSQTGTRRSRCILEDISLFCCVYTVILLCMHLYFAQIQSGVVSCPNNVYKCGMSCCNDSESLEQRLFGRINEISPEAIGRQIEPNIFGCQEHCRKRAGTTWQNTVQSWREILYWASPLAWTKTFSNHAAHKKECMVCERRKRRSESKTKASKGVQSFWKKREFLWTQWRTELCCCLGCLVLQQVGSMNARRVSVVTNM